MTAELGPKPPNSSNGGEIFLPKIEGREPTLDEMRTDLATRCAEIPFFVWNNYYPSLQIVISDVTESPLLPDDSHQREGRRFTVGHDAVQPFLSRNGRLLEKLVHFDSDDPDPKKDFQMNFWEKLMKKNIKNTILLH